MNLKPYGTVVPRVANLVFALLLGFAIGVGFFPGSIFGQLRLQAISNSPLTLAALGVLALVLIGLVILEVAMDRQSQLDRYLLDAFLEHIPDNVFFKDRNSRFLRISRAMAKYCGVTDSAQWINKTDADIFSSEHATEALADEQEIIRTGQPMVQKEEKETWPDGRETWVLTTKVPLKDRSGQIIGTMGIAHNITDRRQAELRIRHMALHDTLTGLPNRILLEDRLKQAISFAGRNRKHVALLMLDLDRFKNVNDSFGHYFGDRLLEVVSSRLKACLRESDTVARFGGDEFVVAIPMITSNEEIERVARKVLATLDEPYQVEGRELQISASIGISQFPDDGEHPEILLQFADAAMYEAKRQGRGLYCFFSPALTEATQHQQMLESDLLHACARNEFVLYYQPFVEAESGRITGAEALLRWCHPRLGLISPNQFIPQLEEMGLMVEVGRWVLRTACLQAMEWQRSGLRPIRMAVNLSTQQFYHRDIVATVESALRESGLDPGLLELELTENRTLDDSDATFRIMQELKGIGVKLSLDDFGTGWSSLSYLRRFPVDRIKIDRSFVRDISSQPGAEAVLKSILNLGRNLGIACIAEGVETRQQRDYLRKQVCSEMQGFYFSRPLPAIDVTALLRSAKLDLNDVPADAKKTTVEVNPAGLQTESTVRSFDRGSQWVH